jgi:hypothetical protein
MAGVREGTYLHTQSGRVEEESEDDAGKRSSDSGEERCKRSRPDSEVESDICRCVALKTRCVSLTHSMVLIWHATRLLTQ